MQEDDQPQRPRNPMQAPDTQPSSICILHGAVGTQAAATLGAALVARGHSIRRTQLDTSASVSSAEQIVHALSVHHALLILCDDASADLWTSVVRDDRIRSFLRRGAGLMLVRAPMNSLECPPLLTGAPQTHEIERIAAGVRARAQSVPGMRGYEATRARDLSDRDEYREAANALFGGVGDARPVLLSGMGGIGKSAIALELVVRARKLGFATAVHRGPWRLASIASVVGRSLLRTPSVDELGAGPRLVDPTISDRLRRELVEASLRASHLFLVLDDCERADRSSLFARHIEDIAAVAENGRLLVTRRAVPEDRFQAYRQIELEALDAAQAMRLAKSLGGLKHYAEQELDVLCRRVAGHPRLLALADALVAKKTRLPVVNDMLKSAADAMDIDPRAPSSSWSPATRLSVLTGARDLMLHELLARLETTALDELLLTASISQLPISGEELCAMSWRPLSASEADTALRTLEGLGLVACIGLDAWVVPRWIAEGLTSRSDVRRRRARAARAAGVRNARADSGGLHESIERSEAARLFALAQRGEDFVTTALDQFAQLSAHKQIESFVDFARDIAFLIPEESHVFSRLVDRALAQLLELEERDAAVALCSDLLDRSKTGRNAESSEDFRKLASAHQRLARARGKESGIPDFEIAIALRREAVRLDRDLRSLREELALTLLEYGELADDAASIAEAARQLRELRDLGALDSRLFGLSDQLEAQLHEALGGDPEGDGEAD